MAYKRKHNPNPHASALGKLGAARRMITMTPEDRMRVARMGGAATKARWERIKAERKQQGARNANQ